ncbi:MAG: GTP-binding protein [Promethearchaeota archaeon]|nr:MAG: GTP-binding protein [Candidatus Lokiarchaeota archaeon]
MVYNFKIILLGQAAVGKSAIADRFVYQQFKEKYMLTIGVQHFTKKVEVDGIEAILTIWDLGGQDRFESIRKLFLNGADGAVFVYDTTNSDSLHALFKWYKDHKEINNKYDICQNILAENKIDLKESVGEVISQKMVDYMKNDPIGNIKEYHSISAKLGIGVNEMFEGLTRLILSIK